MAEGWAFGIVRSAEGPEARALFHELCGVASEVAGVRFTPLVATGYAELVEAFGRRELGLAWLPPVPTIEVEDRGLAAALAIPARRGSTHYHAALVVRRGGPRTVDELKGRRAAWVQRESAAGYLFPRMHIASRGHDVLHFFSREVFVHSHGAVVDAVSSGAADVGATYCHIDGKGSIVSAPWLGEDGKAVRPVEALATIGPIPNDALVASCELPASTRSALARWLFSLDDRARELFARLLDASDLRVPSREHWDALRHTLRAAHARGHDTLPPSSRLQIRPRR